jgi:hypothetical protein
MSDRFIDREKETDCGGCWLALTLHVQLCACSAIKLELQYSGRGRDGGVNNMLRKLCELDGGNILEGSEDGRLDT